MAAEAWQEIRLLRSRLPGEAAKNGERADVFRAALEQAEQLMTAAESVGTAARPLPLFYALSQAGRAIAAAHSIEKWKLRGHGLVEAKVNMTTADLLPRGLKRNTRQDAERQDSFGGVSEAVGSALPAGELTIGQVWAAMPDLTSPTSRLPVSLDRPEWRRPLIAYPRPPRPDQKRGAPLVFVVRGLPGDLTTAQLEAELKNYALPTSVGAFTRSAALKVGGRPFSPFEPRQLVTPGGMFAAAGDDDAYPLFEWGEGPVKMPALIFPGPRLVPRHYGNAVDRLLGEANPDRLIPPRLGGAVVTPLMMWWLLLFGLSIVARYDPELWVASINIDADERAEPVAVALRAGLDLLPGLILDALRAL